MEQIKFLDLRPTGKLANNLNYAYDRVFNSGTYIGGREVEAFENEWAEYCSAKYCVGVGNGHDALVLACSFLAEEYKPIKPGINVPWKTCLPSWSAARKSCTPFPYGDREEPIKMAVHIYGQITLPQSYNPLRLVEDCAQAHGARINGIMAGKFGRMATWSFYPTKNLGALGDAGAITTDDPEVAYYCYDLRQYGNRNDYGINSRLDPLQAAFLRVKLPYLDEWNKRRVENAREYYTGIRRDGCIDVPKLILNDEPNYHIFAIETKDREGLRWFLAMNNIETMSHYKEVPYPILFKIPEAERWTERTLSLPVSPHVTPEQCANIAILINRWMEKYHDKS